MFAIGAAVWIHRYTEGGEAERIAAFVDREFYEPGDPVPGYNLTTVDGAKIGGVDGQDLTPRE